MQQGASRALIALSGVTALLAVTPLAYLLIRVADAGPQKIAAALFRARTLETLVTSVELVVIVVASCILIGVPVAFALARIKIPLIALWTVAFSLPLAIPSYVAAYAWLAAFPGMSGLWAAALVLTTVSLPYVVIPTTIAFRATDGAYGEVSRALGKSEFRTFFSSTMPQVWPVTAAGALLAALYTLSDFGAVALFRVDAFTRVIYTSYRGSFDRTTAAVLAVVLVLLAALLVLGERKIRGTSARWRTSSGTARPELPQKIRPVYLMGVLFAFFLMIAVSLLVPIFSLVQQTMRGSRKSIDYSELFGAAGNTLLISGAAALVTVVAALPIGILVARHRGKTIGILETLAYSGHALPGVVVGLSLVFFTLRVVPVLYQTLLALVFAYVILFLPKAIGATRTSIGSVSPILEDMAQTLGRSPISAWVRTTLRLAAPGVAVGGLLVWLTAMKELPATLMLRPSGFDTLASELWSKTEIAAYGAAAPFALTLIAMAAVPAWLLTYFSDSSARSNRQGLTIGESQVDAVTVKS